MTTRRGDRKISEFVSLTPIPDGGELTYVSSGTNYKIPYTDFVNQLGVSGTLEQSGSPTGTPVLEKAGSTNNIRNLENGSGAKASISAQNGITIEHNFQFNKVGAALTEDETVLSPTFRSLVAGDGINIAGSGDEIQISATDIVVGSQVVLVNSLDDLPDPVANVYTLADDTVYIIGASLDFGTARIEMGENTTIRGQSLLTVSLTSFTTGTFINRSGGGGAGFSGCSIVCPNATVFGYSGTAAGGDVFLIRDFVVVSCQAIAEIDSPVLFSAANFVIISTTVNGFTLQGAGNTVNVDSCVVNDFRGTFFDLGSSVYTFLDAENLNIISNDASNIIIDGLANSANVAAGGQGSLRASSISGDISSSGNILSSDIRWDFSDINLLPDSIDQCYLAMPTNATVTALTQNVPAKIAGTFTVVKESRFTGSTDGTMTYIGTQPISVTVNFTCTFQKSGSGTQSFILYLYKNGVADPNIQARFASDNSRDPNISFTGIVDLVENDFLELFIENTDNSNDITAFAVNFVVQD